MRTDDFAYDLPSELIAQEPAVPRDSCRLMVLDKRTGEVSHEVFTQIVDHIRPGDLLVANETRVMPTRLIGAKEKSGGAAEALLLKELSTGRWECLVKPGRRLKPGAVIEFRAGGAQASPDDPVVLRGTIEAYSDAAGQRVVSFEPVGRTLSKAFHEVGTVPLPPYINGYAGDPELYQTVYSTEENSAAAPTAGLHFTPELIEKVKDAGARWMTVDLEVGVDTFRLVSEDDPTKHAMHTERYHVPQAVVDAVDETHAAGGRVIAVGTTSVRSLESCWDDASGKLVAREDATTSLYILPGYTFHAVDCLITNFHVPRSTLMMLVSALAGHDHIMAAYEEAVRMRYRFFSFGDAMLIE